MNIMEEVIYKFNTIIVKELEERELLASENPFALVLLASLYSLKTNQGTKSAIQQRLFFKKKLARLCFEKGHLKEYIVNLLNFVAFAVSLPKFEESEFKFEVHNLLNHNKMTLAESNPIATDVMFLVMFGMEYQPYIDKKLSEEFAKKAEESERQIEQIKAQAAVAAKEAEAAKTKAVKEAETVKAKAMKAAEAAKAKAEAAKAKAAKAAEKVKLKANKEMELAQNIKRNSVNTLFKFGLSEKEIAKELDITVKSVKEILANQK